MYNISALTLWKHGKTKPWHKIYSNLQLHLEFNLSIVKLICYCMYIYDTSGRGKFILIVKFHSYHCDCRTERKVSSCAETHPGGRVMSDFVFLWPSLLKYSFWLSLAVQLWKGPWRLCNCILHRSICSRTHFLISAWGGYPEWVVWLWPATVGCHFQELWP